MRMTGLRMTMEPAKMQAASVSTTATIVTGIAIDPGKPGKYSG